MGRFMKNRRGQGTVEAALVIPILFMLMLLLLQPCIVLYDRIVMKNALEEGYRLMSTTPDADEKQCTDFMRHRLSAIPQHDLFHVKSDRVDYFIQIEGGADTHSVMIILDNELKPLPIIGTILDALGVTNFRGNIALTEMVYGTLHPDWSFSLTPSEEWVEEW